MNRTSRIRLKQLIGPKLYSQLWEFTSILHGVDQYRDLAKRLPAFAPRTIFDIGANIGQSADRLMRWYPDASIHCFEPADSTYKMLAANMRPFSRVHCHRLAISSGSGTAKMLVYGPGDVANRLQADTVVCDDGKRPGFEDVDVTTVDAFANNIKSTS